MGSETHGNMEFENILIVLKCLFVFLNKQAQWMESGTLCRVRPGKSVQCSSDPEMAFKCSSNI